MRIKNLLTSVLLALSVVCCAKSPVAPPPVHGGGGNDAGNWPPKNLAEPEDIEEVRQLPEAGGLKKYENSLNNTFYRPVQTRYSNSTDAASPSWVNAEARIVPYLDGFDYECTRAEYVKRTDKYGSRTDIGKYAATGRFYVKKIDGRFYFIDPLGYPHIHRGVASLRKGSSSRNAEAFAKKYASDAEWMTATAEELSKIGMHGSGAFSDYSKIQQANRLNPDFPIILAPSFGFLSNFRQKYGLKYCNDDSNTAIALVLDSRWAEFCEEYCREVLAPYVNDPNVLGFFSDNEINFSSSGGEALLLNRILKSGNTSHIAYVEARKFMDSKGATEVTDGLNSEFAGKLAEIYYKGVKEGMQKVDRNMLYLGSRLHGKPKYMEHVVKAAGKWCDVISINYYSRWDVELTGHVRDWAEWAPETPFMVTEFYTKAQESDLNNGSGAGFLVPTHREKAFAYQHFALGLLEAGNCVGWHWFKYQDDDGNDNSGKPANKGIFDNYYEIYPWMGKYVRDLNYNAYKLIDFFDGK